MVAVPNQRFSRDLTKSYLQYICNSANDSKHGAYFLVKLGYLLGFKLGYILPLHKAVTRPPRGEVNDDDVLHLCEMV